MVNNKAYKVAKYAIVLAIIFVAMMIDRAISLIPVGFSMAGCVGYTVFLFFGKRLENGHNFWHIFWNRIVFERIFDALRIGGTSF